MAKTDRIGVEATRLFARLGFEGVSMRQVAGASEVTMAALYYHYPSKEELYEEVVRLSFDDFLSQIRQRWNASPATLRRPSTMAGFIFDAVVDDDSFFLLIQQELHVSNAEERRAVARQRQSKILAVLAHSLENGGGRAVDETETVALAALITGYCEVIHPDRRFSGDERAPFIARHRAALIRHVAQLFESDRPALALAS